MESQNTQTQEVNSEATEGTPKRIVALESLSPELAAKLNERIAEMRSEFMSYAKITEAIAKEFSVYIGVTTVWDRLHNDVALAKSVADKVAIKDADILGTVRLSHKSLRVKFYERLAVGAEQKGRFLQAAQIAFLIGKELGQISDKLEFTGRFESLIGDERATPLSLPVTPSSEALRVN